MPKVRLEELSARSLGVIEQASLEFAEGFCVLTGETGAGKTLLLGALELCLGGDGTQSRHGVNAETRASVVFSSGGQETVLSREASASGRLRASLNGLASNAEALRNAAESLIVIHGQHDSLALRSKQEILRLIDTYGSIDMTRFEEISRKVSELIKIRDSVGGDEAGRQRELDFLKFQLDEISHARITDSEELTTTLQELQNLTEARDGQAAVIEVVNLIDESENSVLDQFASAIARLPQSDSYSAVSKSLRQVLDVAREATRDLAAMADPEAFDPEKLDLLEARVSDLQSLVRKYGPDLGSVIQFGLNLESEVRSRESALQQLATVDSDLQALEAERAVEASKLLAKRTESAHLLTAAVAGQLERVALPHATVRFNVSGEAGSIAEVLFAPNPGQPEGPLQSLASGGELSRVLLAISLETSNSDQVAVFDEVDAGIGGQVAQQIGDCLREVGERQQVLAVTHLASVAAKANQHFVIEKVVDEGRTITTVREVSGDSRVREIARMLAGEINDASLGLAQHLLQDR